MNCIFRFVVMVVRTEIVGYYFIISYYYNENICNTKLPKSENL